MKSPSMDDLSKLILFAAVLLGGLSRFLPVILAGFPVNDGGMFLQMSEELRANGFALPAFTGYNAAGVPYAYPPFGFYATASLSALFGLPGLDLVRWSPAVVSTLGLLAFALMARELLADRLRAGLATLFYALAPASFGWAIMGGGITRAYGLAFLYLTVLFAARLYARPGTSWAALTALAGALAALSHPETGLQAAGACALLWAFRGRTWKSLAWAGAVALGTLALTAPWWGAVIARHGPDPFLSALETSSDGSTGYLQLLTLQIDAGSVFYNLVIALGLAGLTACLARREYALPAWFALPYLLDPRSAPGISFIPLALLAAIGFDQVLAPAWMAARKTAAGWQQDAFALRALFGITLYLFFSAGVYGVQLAGASLSAADRAAMDWVAERFEPGSSFLLLTGEAYSMKDPFQEWFPVLTPHTSRTTLQGLEWTLGEGFFPRYGELVALQRCAAVACVQAWSERTGLTYRYLLIRLPDAAPAGGPQTTLGLLARALNAAPGYRLVGESPGVAVYERLD